MAGEIRNSVKDKIAAGKAAIFMQVKLVESVEIAQIAKTAGFDGFYIDLEHSTMTLRDAAQICIAGLHAGIAPYVRVPAPTPEYIQRCLDGGALGVFVPHVETAEQARAVVAITKYAPIGQRSSSATLPHTRYEKWDVHALRAAMNAATGIVAMIESAAAAANVDEIAAVPGIDVLHIGTSDLCADLGLEGQPDHPKVMEIYRRTQESCLRHGKALGAGGMASHPKLRAKMVELGARLVVTGSDHSFILAEAKRRCAEANAAQTPTNG